MRSPDQVHEWVLLYNWDDGLDPIWPVVENDATEFATALLIYWRLDGPLFGQEPGANAEASQLHALVEKRLLNGDYAKSSLRYDPVVDNGLSSIQVAKLKRSGVPKSLVEPDYDH